MKTICLMLGFLQPQLALLQALDSIHFNSSWKLVFFIEKLEKYYNYGGSPQSK